MVVNNFGKLLIINGFFLFVSFLLLTDLVLLIQVIPNQALLPKELGLNYQTWSAVLAVPLINMVRYLIFGFIHPLQVIANTLVYEKITWEVEHPGIRRKYRAA